MLHKNQKRIILIIIDILFSLFIWYVNASWGNTFQTCLILSTTTFLIVYAPFEIYWSFRDIWYDRWQKIPINELKSITREKVAIEVKSGYIQSDIFRLVNQEKIERINTIIVVLHGFSDTKETIQYYYLPFVLNGYIVMAYDARGIGTSKKIGKRNQFIERTNDFLTILEWIQNHNSLKKMNIFCVGFSIGAITALCGGFEKKVVKKIIAISSMSDYRQNIPKFNPLIMLSYSIKRVKLFPGPEENKNLSPYFVFQKVKQKLTPEEWKQFSQKVMLIHSKNDRIIKFKNFEENKSLLEIPQENTLILKKGGIL